jgi:hypothetical protein
MKQFKHFVPMKRNLHPYIITLMAFLLIAGCRSTTTQISKEESITLAKEEVIRRGWKDFEVGSASLHDGRWLVTIWRLPKTPGAHATIEVSAQGKVIGFTSGM